MKLVNPGFSLLVSLNPASGPPGVARSIARSEREREREQKNERIPSSSLSPYYRLSRERERDELFLRARMLPPSTALVVAASAAIWYVHYYGTYVHVQSRTVVLTMILSPSFLIKNH